MNIPKYSLENQKIIYFFLAVMLIGGIYSFFKLPKKEDSPFVIKQAVLVTRYPLVMTSVTYSEFIMP